MNRIGLVFVGVGALALSVFAQTWQPATGGSWNSPANWSSTTVPDSDTAQVFVANSFTLGPTLSLDRSTAFTVNKLSYNDNSSPYSNCTISAGSPAGSLIFAGVAPTVDTPAASGNAADLVITAPVTASNTLTKTGIRIAYLNGAVTGFGPGVYTNVSAGTLVIGPATTIADWTAINKAVGGGTLRLDALTMVTAPATFSVGAGELSLNPASGTFSFNTAGFTKTGTGTLRFSRDATGPGGSAALTVAGGYLSLSANLSGFASGTVSNGATLQPNAGLTYGNIPLTLTGAGASGSQGALFFRSGGNTTVTWPGAITLGSGGATIGSYGVTYITTLSGAIGGTGPLVLQGQGGSDTTHSSTYTLSANSTYTGDTTFKNNTSLSEARLKLGVNNALPTSTALTLSMGNNNAAVGVTFDLNGKSQQLAGLVKNTSGASNKYRILNSSATASTLTVSNAAACSFDGLIGLTGNANLSLVKQGNATLALSGTNAYSGGTTVSAGTLMVTNAAGSGTGTGNVTVESGATLSGNGIIKGSVTVGGALSGSLTIQGGVAVTNGGTLSGSGIIQGNVTVSSGGTLSGTGVIQGAVSAAAGALLLPGGSGAVGTLTLTNTLALNGSSLTFDVPSSGACDTIALSGADTAGVLILNGANTLALNILSGTLPAGIYTLMTYVSQSGSGTLTLDRPYRNTSLSVGATSVTLTVTGLGVNPFLTWVGDGSSNPWDIGATALWNGGAGAEFFNDFDNVTFSDTGSASPAINLTATVQPTSIVVTNVSKAYIFSGVGGIGGAATLTKQGTNTLSLALANTYSGLTTVSGGRLVYGINDALGTGAVTVNGSGAVLALGTYTDTVGTVTLDNGGQITGTSGTLSTTNTFELKNGTVSAVLAGSGALNMTTPATVTLSGSNTYSGATTVGVNGVSNSVLTVNNSLALGSAVAGTTVNGGYLLTENRINLGNGLTVTDETLTFASANGYRAGLHYTFNTGTGKWDGNIVLATAAAYLNCEALGGTFVIGDSAADTITGTGNGLSLRGAGTIIIYSRINIGATQINRDDNGVAVLNTAGNTWGNTQLAQGTLKLGVSDALPASTALTIGKASAGASAAFDLNGYNQTVAGIAEGHFAGANGTNTQRIISSAPAILAVSNSVANTFGTTNSTIEGKVTLVKLGTGTLTLTGTNTYSGATIVSNGTLAVSASGMLGNSTNITVAAGTLILQNSDCITNTATVRIENGGGAKVNLAAGVNETVGYLYFGDTQKAARTYGATNSGASLIDDAHFAGTGILTVLRGNGGTLLRLR